MDRALDTSEQKTEPLSKQPAYFFNALYAAPEKIEDIRLDPALTRPGRFDRRVPVKLPDLQFVTGANLPPSPIWKKALKLSSPDIRKRTPFSPTRKNGRWLTMRLVMLL